MEIETRIEGAGKGIARFHRLFPTRRRLIIAAAIVCIALIAGAYALFAKFGRPLPGTRYFLPTASPSVTPQVSFSPTPAPSPSAKPTPPPSATPTPAPTPALQAKHLPFSRLARPKLPENATSVTLLEALAKSSRINQQAGDFANIMLLNGATESLLTTREFFTLFGIRTPDGFFDVVSEEAILFFYAPRDTGTFGTVASASQPSHFGLLVGLNDSPENTRNLMRTWEATMGGDLAPLAIDRPFAPGSSTLFNTNVFQGATIRYQNFPDPYTAIDYTVYEGSSPALLVITTSRESMYAAVAALNFGSE